MSGLKKYNGNFLKYVDNEFEYSSNRSQRFRQVNSLDIDICCDIAIIDSSETFVDIDTDDLSDFSIRQDGDCLVICQKNDVNANVINIGGTRGDINISGNVNIVNVQVFVNGVPVDHSQGQVKQKRQSRIKVHIAANEVISLHANMKGSSVLASKIIFKKARIKVSGQSTVGVAAKSLDLNLSGQGDSYVVLKGGELNIKLSGQGNIRAKGEWAEADISISGQGTVKTEGFCNGNYHASVSGMGTINHSGTISGRANKNVSGMGNITIE